MNLRWTTRRIAFIVGLIAAAVALFGIHQVQSKIYFPIDKETLMITQAIAAQKSEESL